MNERFSLTYYCFSFFISLLASCFIMALDFSGELVLLSTLSPFPTATTSAASSATTATSRANTHRAKTKKPYIATIPGIRIHPLRTHHVAPSQGSTSTHPTTTVPNSSPSPATPSGLLLTDRHVPSTGVALQLNPGRNVTPPSTRPAEFQSTSPSPPPRFVPFLINSISFYDGCMTRA